MPLSKENEALRVAAEKYIAAWPYFYPPDQAAFHALANPVKVLALLAELEVAQREAARRLIAGRTI